MEAAEITPEPTSDVIRIEDFIDMLPGKALTVDNMSQIAA